MNHRLLLLGFAMLFLSIRALAQAIALPDSLEAKIPFDPGELVKAPNYRWEHQKDAVWSLIYEGEMFRGKTTEAFAYYASPATIGEPYYAGQKYPAIVAVHGGGGTAFRTWVLGWAKKGYAAIAMDLGGTRPLPIEEQIGYWSTKTIPLVNGGP
ncbi:MAG: hypothetical protein HRU12_15585, partial [Phaeodactylibacter sp.]|nr:hypothetical protein [Phaeodactylibacter sp.]